MIYIPFPDKKYRVIYADPPWEYRQRGRGAAASHYDVMALDDICDLPVSGLCDTSGGGTACFMWATFPNIREAIVTMEAWGFIFKTAAFVWVKKTASGKNRVGMGAYTRANAEVCLLGVSPGARASDLVAAHNVGQIIEAPYRGHSRKPDEARERIVQLMGDVPRIELFARERADGWDAWGNEVPGNA